MKLLIDEKEADYEIGDCRAGWCDVFEMGETLSGRRARVARHLIPQDLLKTPGAVRTGGHVYETRRA